MEDIVLWIQIGLTVGGTVTGGRLMKKYRTAQAILAQDPDRLLRDGEVTRHMADKLRTVGSQRSKAKSIAAVCRNFGWQVLTPESKLYPQSFFSLKDPPLVVYADGDLTYLRHRQKAAVVGTREADVPCMAVAYDLAAVLSQCGIVTVSGGAVGIDSAAHEGALTSAGGTICLLGMGLGHQYMNERAFMRRRIAQRGVLLTENIPFEEPKTAAFPRRNRLIAALGETVTVIQSFEHGGSMITANYAKEYGKPLYALSPSVYASRGCEKLISEGAVRLEYTGQLTSFYDIAGADDWPLINGGAVPKILTPEKCTLAEFAWYNGVTVAEAKPLYEELCGGEQVSEPYRFKNYLNRADASGKAGKKAAPAPQRREKAPAPKRREKAPAPQRIEKAPAPQYPHGNADVRTADAHGLSGDVRKAFLALSYTPRTMDEIAVRAGLSAVAVMGAVTALELAGLARSLPGNMVALVEER